MSKNLFSAIEKWSIKDVQTLLDNWEDVDSKRWGSTPLMEAAFSGKKEIVKILLDYSADPNIKNSSRWWTALHFATMKWHKKIIELLIEYWADIEAEDWDNIRPIMMASAWWNKDIVNLFIEYWADIEAKSWPWCSALGFAAAGWHKDIVKLLLDSGANDFVDRDWATSICYAIESEDSGTIELILKKWSVINYKDSTNGETPLMKACSKWNYKIVKLLLEYWADVNMKTWWFWKTALNIAKKWGHEKIVELLKEYWA